MSLPTPSSTGIPDPRDFREFEEPLMELAQRSRGDLRKLLTAFFGFLHRRTDFYCVGSSSGIGFQQGEAEKMLLAAFRQYPLRKLPNRPPPPAATTGIGAAHRRGAPSGANPSTTAAESSKSSATEKKAESLTSVDCKAPSSAPEDTNDKDDSVPRLSEDGLQIPVGNGGWTKRYKWTQTLEECSVLIPIPKNLRGKDLDVQLKPMTLVVRAKDGTTIFVDGNLVAKIVPGESTWTLEGGVLQVVLFKQTQTFWKTILEGDDEIDTSLVDNRRHITSYDEGTQAQIRKIMHDQEREAKGLPPVATRDLSSAGLPPGVEYIDQTVLDRDAEDKKK